uniref:Uncharacterized protein n=1 Tax=Plectus sambesii TaxID=2011161 RepID=A0A914V9Q0_9BILA
TFCFVIKAVLQSTYGPVELAIQRTEAATNVTRTSVALLKGVEGGDGFSSLWGQRSPAQRTAMAAVHVSRAIDERYADERAELGDRLIRRFPDGVRMTPDHRSTITPSFPRVADVELPTTTTTTTTKTTTHDDDHYCHQPNISSPHKRAIK